MTLLIHTRELQLYASAIDWVYALACPAVSAHIHARWLSARGVEFTHAHALVLAAFVAWLLGTTDLRAQLTLHALPLALLAGVSAGGRAIGIDIWRSEDQSGNSQAAVLANAEAEGVRERVEVQTADARELPFAEASFDVVVSSWALHNIEGADEGGRALREIMRVLKPKGRLALIDIQHVSEYAGVLRRGGAESVHVSGPSRVFFIPTHTLLATKP